MQDILRRKFSCKYLVSERHEIENLVRNRLKNLNLPAEDYSMHAFSCLILLYISLMYFLCTECEHEKRDSISFVIINPSADLKLEVGDIV